MKDLKTSMSATWDDRISTDRPQRTFFWIAAFLLAVLGLTCAWFYYTNFYDETTTAEDKEPPADLEETFDITETPSPDIPHISLEPTIDQIIEYPDSASVEVDEDPIVLTEVEVAVKIRESLLSYTESPLFINSINSDNLIQRITAIIEATSKGIFVPRLLSLNPLKDKFRAIEKDGVLIIDPKSYRRYDPYVEALMTLEVGLLKEMFHEYRIHLEKTYAKLGHAEQELDNAIIRALDEIISVPKIQSSIPITPHEAIYRFTDKELENLPDLHKQLLRMGPENIEKIQTFAKDLRSSLLEETE